MAIAPLTITPQQDFSSFDFSPLMQLGNQMRQQKQADTLASLGQRYGVDPAAAAAAMPAAATATAAGPAGPAGAGDLDKYGQSIAAIESSGRYDKLGPVTPKGDRAYGMYQVMGKNIPEWTKAALGRTMTPSEFLLDPAAQKAVFNHRFGIYANKYGPEGAARAWFAGPGGMNNLNATDQLGTTVSDYGRRFSAGVR